MGNIPHMAIDADGGFSSPCPPACGNVAFEVMGREVVGAVATRLPAQTISTAALAAGLTTFSTAIPGHSRWQGAIEVDKRSWFYRNVAEPVTDRIYGISRSIAGGLTPEFHSSNSNKARDREIGEKYLGPIVQYAFSGGGGEALPNRPILMPLNRMGPISPRFTPIKPSGIHRMSGSSGNVSGNFNLSNPNSFTGASLQEVKLWLLQNGWALQGPTRSGEEKYL